MIVPIVRLGLDRNCRDSVVFTGTHRLAMLRAPARILTTAWCVVAMDEYQPLADCGAQLSQSLEQCSSREHNYLSQARGINAAGGDATQRALHD
jgi:hypothetical protein